MAHALERLVLPAQDLDLRRHLGVREQIRGDRGAIALVQPVVDIALNLIFRQGVPIIQAASPGAPVGCTPPSPSAARNA